MALVLDGTLGITTNSGTAISASTIGVGGATPSTSGAGITFPATASASSNANTLDDYEEGTWTVTVSGSTSGSGTVPATATYTKIGRLVTVFCNISNQTFPTYVGDLRISLPFTSANNSINARGTDCYYFPQANWDTQANWVGFVTQVNPNVNYVIFPYILLDSDRQNILTSANTTTSNTANLYVQFTVTYETPT